MDNTIINAPTTPGQTIATKDIGGVNHELVILEFSDGVGGATEVSDATPLPVTDAAVLAKLSSDPATQTTLAALLAKVIAAPSTEAKQDATNALLTTIAAITQPLTDTQLRATPVPISGTVTANTGLSQPLTDAQLRLTPVPVSGTVTVDTSLLSTASKQDQQTALITTLNSLVENLNSLVNILLPLGAAMNSGAPALRVNPIASVSTAVTGSVTATVASTVVSSLTNFGTGIPASEMANDFNNLLVEMANINNVTI